MILHRNPYGCQVLAQRESKDFQEKIGLLNIKLMYLGAQEELESVLGC